MRHRPGWLLSDRLKWLLSNQALNAICQGKGNGIGQKSDYWAEGEIEGNNHRRSLLGKSTRFHFKSSLESGWLHGMRILISKLRLCFTLNVHQFSSVSSVAQSCPTLCNPMNHSTPGLPVHYKLPEFTQTHVHQVGDAIQPSHPLSSLSPPAPNPSQHQGLFQWVNSSHEVAKVLEFQL